MARMQNISLAQSIIFQMKPKNLEDKLLYRFVKTAYIICFIGVSLVAVFLGWSAKPTPFIDSTKSTLACENGKQYRLDDAKIYLFSKTASLSNYEEVDARKLCAYGVLNDYSSEYQNLKTPQYKNYSINTVESINGSWFSVILWWVLGIGISYIVLNLLRETLNYILFGKKFDWLWLIIPFGLLAMVFSSDRDTEK